MTDAVHIGINMGASATTAYVIIKSEGGIDTSEQVLWADSVTDLPTVVTGKVNDERQVVELDDDEDDVDGVEDLDEEGGRVEFTMFKALFGAAAVCDVSKSVLLHFTKCGCDVKEGEDGLRIVLKNGDGASVSVKLLMRTMVEQIARKVSAYLTETHPTVASSLRAEPCSTRATLTFSVPSSMPRSAQDALIGMWKEATARHSVLKHMKVGVITEQTAAIVALAKVEGSRLVNKDTPERIVIMCDGGHANVQVDVIRVSYEPSNGTITAHSLESYCSYHGGHTHSNAVFNMIRLRVMQTNGGERDPAVTVHLLRFLEKHIPKIKRVLNRFACENTTGSFDLTKNMGVPKKFKTALKAAVENANSVSNPMASMEFSLFTIKNCFKGANAALHVWLNKCAGLINKLPNISKHTPKDVIAIGGGSLGWGVSRLYGYAMGANVTTRAAVDDIAKGCAMYVPPSDSATGNYPLPPVSVGYVWNPVGKRNERYVLPCTGMFSEVPPEPFKFGEEGGFEHDGTRPLTDEEKNGTSFTHGTPCELLECTYDLKTAATMVNRLPCGSVLLSDLPGGAVRSCIAKTVGDMAGKPFMATITIKPFLQGIDIEVKAGDEVVARAKTAVGHTTVIPVDDGDRAGEDEGEDKGEDEGEDDDEGEDKEVDEDEEVDEDKEVDEDEEVDEGEEVDEDEENALDKADVDDNAKAKDDEEEQDDAEDKDTDNAKANDDDAEDKGEGEGADKSKSKRKAAAAKGAAKPKRRKVNGPGRRRAAAAKGMATKLAKAEAAKAAKAADKR